MRSYECAVGFARTVGSRLGARLALADQRGVPVAAGLDAPDLGVEVDVDQAEALVIAVGPLEVVQERPGEVSGQGDALVRRTGTGREVALQVGDALAVVDHSGRVDHIVPG